VPAITSVAVLVDPAYRVHAGIPSAIEREARALDVQLQRVEAGAPAAFEAAFAAMVRARADALMIMESALLGTHREQIMALALRHRLPTNGIWEALYPGRGPLILWSGGLRDV